MNLMKGINKENKMNTEQNITKVSQIFVRDNGNQVRITAQRYCSTPGSLKSNVNVMVHYRKNKSENWNLCNNRPDKNWRKMSVDEYVKEGRPEMFRYATIMEILKVSSMLSV